jgi:GNAT superfamily N-acetyltransferase
VVDDLIRRACESIEGFLALGNESIDVGGALVIRNRDTPSRYDSNHTALIRVGRADVKMLLRRVDAELGHVRYRRFDIDPLTPPEFAARLTLDGYAAWEGLHLILEGELRASPRRVDIREVRTEDDWARYAALMDADYAEVEERTGNPLPDLNRDEWRVNRRLKAPAVRGWIAYVDDVAGGLFSSWPGENGVGQIEDLFVLPEYRHRGLATALIAHCVADARERGAEAIVITADAKDTPKQMYAAMGFRPLFVSRSYLKHLE